MNDVTSQVFNASKGVTRQNAPGHTSKDVSLEANEDSLKYQRLNWEGNVGSGKGQNTACFILTDLK